MCPIQECNVPECSVPEWELPLATIALILGALPAKKIAQCSCISSAWRHASRSPSARKKVRAALGAMLHEPAKNGNIDRIKYLLSRGADVEVTGVVGMTALHIAAVHCQVPVVQAIVDSGANLEARDSTGQTPLMLAAVRGCSEVAKVLIAAGAKLDTEAYNGWTALMEAAWGGQHHVFHILIAAGASVKDPECKASNSGKSTCHKDEVANTLVHKLMTCMAND